MIFNKHLSGFTLLELVIAMAILAILSGALLANFFTSITKGRDSRRKQDLELIGKALELYYNDNRAYPTGLPLNLTTPTPFAGANNVIYMQTPPNDPKFNNGFKYFYNSPNGSFYQLYACLENKNDPKRQVGGYVGTNCGCPMEGNNVCNYGIASLNASP